MEFVITEFHCTRFSSYFSLFMVSMFAIINAVFDLLAWLEWRETFLKVPTGKVQTVNWLYSSLKHHWVKNDFDLRLVVLIN